PIGTYASLSLSADQSDAGSQKLSPASSNAATYFSSETSFVKSELLALDESVLEDIKVQAPGLPVFIDDLLRQQPYQLDPQVERVHASYSSVFNGPYELYTKTKLLDIDFGTFEADGVEIP